MFVDPSTDAIALRQEGHVSKTALFAESRITRFAGAAPRSRIQDRTVNRRRPKRAKLRVLDIDGHRISEGVRIV